MKKHVLPLILFAVLTMHLDAQDADPQEQAFPPRDTYYPSFFGLSIAYLSENIGLPFLTVPSNPGFMIGAEFTLYDSGHVAIVQAVNLGYSCHVSLLHVLSLNTTCSLTWWIADSVTIEAFIGIGAYDVFHEGKEFIFDRGEYVFEGGIYRQVTLTIGDLYAYAPIGFGLGYDFSRENILPIELFAKYEFSLQFAAHEYFPILPHATLTGGITWHF